jgi:hypothetical protein
LGAFTSGLQISLFLYSKNLERKLSRLDGLDREIMIGRNDLSRTRMMKERDALLGGQLKKGCRCKKRALVVNWLLQYSDLKDPQS